VLSVRGDFVYVPVIMWRHRDCHSRFVVYSSKTLTNMAARTARPNLKVSPGSEIQASWQAANNQVKKHHNFLSRKQPTAACKTTLRPPISVLWLVWFSSVHTN